MIKGENKITQFQLFFIIIQTQIGIGVISLPYDVFKISQSDAWISVFVAGCLMQIAIYLIWLLYRRFQALTIFEMMSEIVGKHVAFLLEIGYIFYFFATAILIILQFGQKVNIWILPRTPIWIVSVLLIVISVLCVKENLRVMARFFVVVSILLIVLFTFTLVVLKDLNYLYTLPVGQSGLPNMVKGATNATFAYQGFELLLVVFPYCLGKGVGKLKVAFLANGFVTFFYTYLTMVVLTYFGPSAMKFIPEPILYIMKFKYFKIIDRVDLLFFSIWIVSVATSFMMYLYLTSNGLTHLFRKKNHSLLVFYAAALMIICALTLPTDEKVIKSLSELIDLARYVFIFVLPCILLIVSMVRGKKKLSGDVQS
ncbi:GerAB/ArcD/ProY family transporter [Paenibacillus sp. LMG 31458]|uniref:GerAB/ArcD/ProY family transporter n=1 Tax=Paenibacillus phytorum TaxID=2654977 RepID=A0ABX1XRU7_9BACL|nr:endospore germination permease [Paenibacillus phytorum]NOU71272.1 GerAB/ArcD/ProY family transporter [Paenibacillus phytorum]